MDLFKSLSHISSDGKYPYFLYKNSSKISYVVLGQYLGEILIKFACQSESKIEEGNLMSDHVHMMISASHKYSVSHVVSYINCKSAIHLARVYTAHCHNYVW